MDELMERIQDLTAGGFCCSQIMLMLSLEMKGQENPEMVRAMAGLCRGMYKQSVCGTLAAGSCLIAGYGAKGDQSDYTKFPYMGAIQVFYSWFEKEFGSVSCKDIVSDSIAEQLEVCPSIIYSSFNKCMELLTELGIDVYE